MRRLALLPAGLPPARRALILGLGLFCLLVVAGLGLGLQGLISAQRAEAERQRWSFWQVTQAQIELQRFSATLARSAAGDAAAQAELPLRLDLLWGRINQLEILEVWEESPALQALRARLPDMLGVLRVVEDALPATPAGLPALQQRLMMLEQPLLEAARVLNAIHQDRERARVLDVAAHLAWFTAGFLLLALATGMLVALCWWRSLQAQAALRRAEAASARTRAATAMLRAVIDNTPALISAYAADLRCVFANRAMTEYTGRAEHELVGRRPTEAGLSAALEADLAAALAGGEVLAAREREVPHADGSQRVLLTTTAPVPGAAGSPVRVLRIALDVTERREAERRARHLTEHDPLTGLLNRAHFSRALAAAAGQADSRPFALHVVDLDQFRRVNDTHGQAAGDALLVAAAIRLSGILRAGDQVARLGADEFAVLQRITEPGDAALLAQRAATVLAQPYQIGGMSLRCTASLGAVAVQQPSDSPEGLLACAELALREARRAGRGRFALFRPEMEGEAAARRALQADLAQALAEGALHIVYQPKFRVPGRRLAGVEALLRWTHPRQGPLSPALFVPLAEEAGLALPLARYVLRTAARQAAEWRAKGLSLPVAVNLSAELVAEADTLAMVREGLEEAGLPATLLEIEVTESSFIGDSSAAREMFEGLSALGVSVGLDDFGTGFSSLGYLQDLPVDVIKVDRSFVSAMERGGAAPRIVETVVRLAHSLGARVVAEGVETEAQLSQLQALGCDMVQGFLLGRPMPAEAILALARTAQESATPAA